MPDLAAVLRAEITRLARKEIRQQVSATQKTAAQHRRDIAQLKRELQDHERKIAALETVARERLAESRAGEKSTDATRFSTRSVKAQRKRLGLSAEQFGRILGVSSQTVYNWERGRTRPGKAQFDALVALRQIGRRDALRRLKLLESDETPDG